MYFGAKDNNRIEPLLSELLDSRVDIVILEEHGQERFAGIQTSDMSYQGTTGIQYVEDSGYKEEKLGVSILTLYSDANGLHEKAKSRFVGFLQNICKDVVSGEVRFKIVARISAVVDENGKVAGVHDPIKQQSIIVRNGELPEEYKLIDKSLIKEVKVGEEINDEVYEVVISEDNKIKIGEAVDEGGKKVYEGKSQPSPAETAKPTYKDMPECQAVNDIKPAQNNSSNNSETLTLKFALIDVDAVKKDGTKIGDAKEKEKDLVAEGMLEGSQSAIPTFVQGLEYVSAAGEAPLYKATVTTPKGETVSVSFNNVEELSAQLNSLPKEIAAVVAQVAKEFTAGKEVIIGNIAIASNERPPEEPKNISKEEVVAAKETDRTLVAFGEVADGLKEGDGAGSERPKKAHTQSSPAVAASQLGFSQLFPNENKNVDLANNSPILIALATAYSGLFAPFMKPAEAYASQRDTVEDSGSDTKVAAATPDEQGDNHQNPNQGNA